MSCASTQVGQPQIPLFVMCKREAWHTPRMYKQFQSFINPQILEASEETCQAWEGCISNTDDLCLVERPAQLKVRFHTIQGKEIDLFCQGLVARIFLHEVDHLRGQVMWE
jgi:peptide deformylase